METGHQFRVVAWWASGRAGLAKSDTAPNAIHFTAPVAFGGYEGRWTPEDLLLCSLASCYTTTFRTLAERSSFEYTDLQTEVTGAVERKGAEYGFSEIVIRVHLLISRAEEQERGLKLLQKAKAACLVSRALAVPQTFETSVTLPSVTSVC
ncbi:MAG: OsmC family protein [Acidobacteria bacterium]|jgi:peroxiredoxin-like protein|nr:OsmC family protein [Acidobacteriota bacterium]